MAPTAEGVAVIAEIEAAIQLRGARKEGQEYRFLCPRPEHDDHNPSARWNPEKETWYCDVCRTGGGARDLARRLGIPMAGTSPRVVACYDYFDADGSLLYQQLRLEPKAFRMRRPDGGGGWTWKLDGTPRVLYRLPELVASETELVFIVEGEKDVERLRALGFLATTNPGGAGKWRPEFSNYLAGRNVAVLPDNDAAGERHGELVAASLRPVAASVKLVRLPGLPPKGDVSDWLDAEGNGAQLAALVAAAPEWEAPIRSSDPEMDLLDERTLTFESAREFATAVTEAVPWLVPGYVAAGAITEIGGKVKRAGKTTFILALCGAVVRGDSFLERDTEAAPVVYLTEQAGTSFREALRRADLLERDDFYLLPWSRTRGWEWDCVAKEAVRFAHSVGARLLVVDTLGQFAKIDGDAENSSGAALGAMRPLQEATATGLAVAVLRHERKSGGEVGESARGSSAFAGAVDIVVAIRRVEGSTVAENVRVLYALSRFDETPTELAVELGKDGRYRCVGDSTAITARLAKEHVLNALPEREEDAIAAAGLAEGSKIARAALYDACRDLARDGSIRKKGEGRKGSPFLYWRPRERE